MKILVIMDSSIRRTGKKINERCCDFKLLEEKCREYKK